ncbi:HigA family addiction module antitoxin [Vibrio vulnificus]|uniref:HigA family addiction module antitoxin n=1 Tax=Vibrio cholerae TaxID=666 RepID=UPI001A300490|nr:HigA family addiction module antidote protein [Vibrio vulnificus]EHD0093023.1 HigA family addiction module antidote protein [Vibrio vulnificus]
MMTDQSYISDLAIPPGEYLEEVLDDLELSQAELARRMGRPPQAINEIIKGEKAITPDTAIQLEQVVGVPAEFWNNLESEYRLVLAKEQEMLKAQQETEAVSKFPYLEMSKLGLVKKTRNAIEKVKELQKFFGVSSLFNIENVKEYSPAFRLCEKDTISREAIAAWLRTGHLLASEQNVADFDKNTLKNKIENIRLLSLESDPNVMLCSLKQLLADCGVALVIIPHYPKTYVTGATFWYGKNKPVIMMSMRGSWGDIFWFSLMHELAHILLHDKRITFIEGGSISEDYKVQEEEADTFSQETLIPKRLYDAFISKYDFSPTSIEIFAKSIAIHPGIVTGRLQHDKHLSHLQHHHRIRYKWK